MPAYDWLQEQTLDISTTKKKLSAMKLLGVPYTEFEIDNGNNHLMQQADTIASNLKKEGISISKDKELVAIIAYLQRLGTDIKRK
jgi:cytochrome c oxidase cbb3-type subunit I/II